MVLNKLKRIFRREEDLDLDLDFDTLESNGGGLFNSLKKLVDKLEGCLDEEEQYEEEPCD